MLDLLGSSRYLARRPGLVAAVLITFVLGIAANGVVFNLVYDALVRALPYGDPSRLVLVSAEPNSLSSSGGGFAVTLPQFREWQARSTSFEHAALYSVMRYTASGLGDPALVRVAVVSAEYFQALQVQPLQGRTWSPDKDASPVIIVSQRYWRRHAEQGRPAAEASLALNGVAFSIIGVMHERVELLTGETDAWIPLEMARWAVPQGWCRSRSNSPGMLVSRS